ncbi:glycosyltransferase [Pseudomonas sp. LjRoot71]|uniref:glycosyltransferase n=1 Tax=Pseudomonas sp. LjRoot71 TaxID=3342336 RepID=UPI003ECE6264
MKIAIMTQPLGKNYGGIMQAWALQQVLKRMGHEVVTIDRQRDQPSMPYKSARLIFRTGMNIIGKRKAPINFEKHLPTLLQHTTSFIDQYITMSEPLYSTQQLREHFDRENYDAVIVGSDQTWRPKYSPNIYNFFLDFLEDKEILRIAYASSFGVDEWEYTEEQTQRCAELAKKFNAISVREDSGVHLCKKYLGVDASHVLDPTLLLDKETYEKLLDQTQSNTEPAGLYRYLLDPSPESEYILNTYSQHLSAQAFSTQAEQDFYRWSTNDLSKYVMPSPKSWIEGFQRATAVATDSFHGSAFSIIFKKPFITIVNKERGASRFSSLLGALNLTDRLLSPYDEIKDLNTIDWPATEKRIDTQTAYSIDFLRNSIEHNNHNSIKVSIIVPVYNTEQYIEKCLTSITQQTHKNIEIIIVNDGSTDNSEKIIHACIKNDARAIYISQPNQGVSAARNTGLAEATGEYILFCDSDDYYPRNAVEKLVRKAVSEAAGIVIGNFFKKTKLGRKLIKVVAQESPQSFIESIVTGINHGGPCTKMFTKEILEGITFKHGIKFREDVLFLIDVLLKKPHLAYVEDAIYIYVKRKGSAANTIDVQALESSDLVSHLLKKTLEDIISDRAMKRMLAIDAYSIIVNSSGTLSKQQLSTYVRATKKTNWPIFKKIALLLANSKAYRLIQIYKNIKRRLDNLISY